MFDTTLTVFDTVNAMGQWDLDVFHGRLPQDTVQKLMAFPPPLEHDGADSLGWNGTSHGGFTASSAYASLTQGQQQIEGDWATLWRWKGPRRVQVFSWLVAHGRLLTNQRRHKWNGSVSTECPWCNGEEESILHVLRDCRHALLVWQRLVPPHFLMQFRSYGVKDWVFANLKEGLDGIYDTSWAAIFMVACWFLWRWRNCAIFENGFVRPENAVHIILKFAHEVDHVQFSYSSSHKAREVKYIHWKAPEDGWIKLNSDGAYKGGLNMAGCGGLLRDSFGNWIKGFTRKLGRCDAIHAEM